MLMFENRSFDHMLGYLDHPSLPRLDETVTNPRDPSDPQSGLCRAHPVTSDGDVPKDPGHGYADVTRQLTCAEPPLQRAAIDNRGFAWNYGCHAKDASLACEIMAAHTPDELPALSTLAREFAVCSRWFCSVPSETWPNRLFLHGAQSEGLLHNVPKPYLHPTTFRRLEETRHRWAVYCGDLGQSLAYLNPPQVPIHRFHPLHVFFEDVQNGTLPEYSFVEPRCLLPPIESQHPTAGVAGGDALLRRVYEALAANPNVWESLLFIVTFDEHGGFFDREKPPAATPPFAGAGQSNFGFDVLGPRVPAVVVSPFIPPLTVDPEAHDHTSVIRTLWELFDLGEPLTARDAAATSVLHLLTADDARKPPPLPPPAEAQAPAAAEAPASPIALDDLQKSLVQLAALLEGPARADTLAVPPPAPAFATPAELELLVQNVQARHMGTREDRLEADARR